MDIPRLSSTEHLILELLAGEDMFGLQLVEQSQGALKRGTVYVTLGRMQDKGYVESWPEKQAPGAIGLPRQTVSAHRAWASGARRVESRRARDEASTQARARLMIPGRMLHRLAAFLCSDKSLRQVIEPAIADFQNEYILATARPALQRLSVLLSGYAAFVQVIAMTVLASPLAIEDRRALRSVLMWGAGTALFASSALILVVLLAFEPHLAKLRPVHALFAIAATLPYALPAGWILGIGFGLGGGTESRRARSLVVIAAVAASALSLVTVVSAARLGSMAFQRTIAASRGEQSTPASRATEMGPGGLQQAAERALSEGQVGRARRFSWQYHMLRSISFATIFLTAFAFALRDVWNRAPRSAVMAACALYFLLLIAGEVLIFELRRMPPILAAWMPNIAFVAATVILMSARTKQQRALS